MKVEQINLKTIFPDVLDHDLYLDSCLYTDNYEFNNTRRKNVLVLPGGGYIFLSEREKDPIMFAFLAKGYNTYSLSYSCNKEFPIPHVDVACAMLYIATHSDVKDTIICGFSAGGHLAATYGYIYKLGADSPKEAKLIKPFALLLGYPVISLVSNNKNIETKKLIAGNNKRIHKLLSAELHVRNDYPPTFAFTTKTDGLVDYHQTLLLKNALIKHNVKNKCIIYSSGPHGLALANEATYSNKKEFLNKEVSSWVDEAHEFIKSLKGEKIKC